MEDIFNYYMSSREPENNREEDEFRNSQVVNHSDLYDINRDLILLPCSDTYFHMLLNQRIRDLQYMETPRLKPESPELPNKLQYNSPAQATDKQQELSRGECLSIVLNSSPDRKAKLELKKAENQDIYSKVYFKVESWNLDPFKNSLKCIKIYEDEFEDISIQTVPQRDRKEWIPLTMSKATGQEKDNLKTSRNSLCGMMNLRHKGAWKRKSSEEVRRLLNEDYRRRSN